jgi:hypothetical protein
MFMTKVLGHCSELEQRVAEIYRQLGGKLKDDPEWENFWRRMAAEEQHHAKILTAEKAALEVDSNTGYWMPEFPVRFVRIDTLLKQIEEQAQREVSKDEMFDFALQIEQSELDAIYRDLAPLGRIAVKLMTQHLEESLALPSHQQGLLEGVKRFLPSGPVREKVEKWATQLQTGQRPTRSE